MHDAQNVFHEHVWIPNVQHLTTWNGSLDLDQSIFVPTHSVIVSSAEHISENGYHLLLPTMGC